MRNWLIGVGIALSVALTAQAAIETKAATDTKGKKTTLTCPVSGEAVENPSKAPRYTYKGKTYYFCGTKCLNKFKASPTTYLARKPTKANASSQAANANKKACCSDKQGDRCCAEEKGVSASGKSCCAEEKGKSASGKSCCAEEKGKSASGKSCCSEKKAAGDGQQPDAGKGQADESTQTAEAAKLFCPVSEEEITVEESVAFEYDGKRYYVCCNGCKRKFLADPETYAKKAERLSPLQGKPIEKENKGN
jgi:Cu+-exporting ATPase